MFKKKLLKIIPYLVAIITGVIFYFLAVILDEKFYDLLINISATFFAIPLLYFFYETLKSFSHRKLNREIFDYAKLQVDRELLSILNQLQKIVFTLEKKDSLNKDANEFLSYKSEDIESEFQENQYLGFQVFKHWNISEKGLHDLLKNPFILEKMEDEQVISIIGILKSLRVLENIQKIDELYIETNEHAEGYKITNGSEMNSENKKLPDRHILLKHLVEDRFVVQDFGDIPKYNLDKCLKYFKVNDEMVKDYAGIIFDLLEDINSWLGVTGSEFIIDTKMFKIRAKSVT